jgi:hypothetical protein
MGSRARRATACAAWPSRRGEGRPARAPRRPLPSSSEGPAPGLRAVVEPVIGQIDGLRYGYDDRSQHGRLAKKLSGLMAAEGEEKIVGTISGDRAKARIDRVHDATITRWAEQLMTAGKLTDVFRVPAARRRVNGARNGRTKTASTARTRLPEELEPAPDGVRHGESKRRARRPTGCLCCPPGGAGVSFRRELSRDPDPRRGRTDHRDVSRARGVH